MPLPIGLWEILEEESLVFPIGKEMTIKQKEWGPSETCSPTNKDCSASLTHNPYMADQRIGHLQPL